MKGATGNMQLMRIFLKESDHIAGKPLYIELLSLLQRHGVRGGTAIRGIAGFGAHSRLHTDRIFRLTADLPVIVEVVDSPEKLAAILPEVDALLESGLITLEDIASIVYSHPREPRER